MTGNALAITVAETAVIPGITLCGSILVSELLCTDVFWIEHIVVCSWGGYFHVRVNVGFVDKRDNCCVTFTWFFGRLIWSGVGIL